MLQKQIILLLLLLLSSCGYEAIYSKKNSVDYDFTVSDLNFVGDRSVNLKIKEKLRNYAKDKKEKDFILKISKRPKNKKNNICTQQAYKYYTIKNAPKTNYTSSFIATIILWV